MRPVYKINQYRVGGAQVVEYGAVDVSFCGLQSCKIVKIKIKKQANVPL
jgi:hypothetical protein